MPKSVFRDTTNTVAFPLHERAVRQRAARRAKQAEKQGRRNIRGCFCRLLRLADSNRSSAEMLLICLALFLLASTMSPGLY